MVLLLPCGLFKPIDALVINKPAPIKGTVQQNRNIKATATRNRRQAR